MIKEMYDRVKSQRREHYWQDESSTMDGWVTTKGKIKDEERLESSVGKRICKEEMRKNQIWAIGWRWTCRDEVWWRVREQKGKKERKKRRAVESHERSSRMGRLLTSIKREGRRKATPELNALLGIWQSPVPRWMRVTGPNLFLATRRRLAVEDGPQGRRPKSLRAEGGRRLAVCSKRGEAFLSTK